MDEREAPNKSQTATTPGPDANPDEAAKSRAGYMSPRAHAPGRSSSGKLNCLCSPTTHAGSFRCRLHRSVSMSRISSVGSNLSELGSKQGAIIDGSVEAQ